MRPQTDVITTYRLHYSVRPHTDVITTYRLHCSVRPQTDIMSIDSLHGIVRPQTDIVTAGRRYRTHQKLLLLGSLFEGTVLCAFANGATCAMDLSDRP